ncbi:hypothetical protein AMATHDRAFT_50346 [Amanita thiersii Skay4041]|uniref:Uncharacterized protein n=1 Tax=Amanita thiersii Skay4041 TaxID=703135 RepID=A0A2A9NI68_9AGAR|nr:hypothetical protein AMATHDRAFT_50346 [Amanita thiersii Skay4041]
MHGKPSNWRSITHLGCTVVIGCRQPLPTRTPKLNTQFIDSLHQRGCSLNSSFCCFLDKDNTDVCFCLSPALIFRDMRSSLFQASGFRQEGVRRRAYYNPFENEWQDIAYMAILDTDWALQRGQRPRNQHHPDEKQITTWDEMIFRHTKEREEILLWEERTGDFSDTETIHGFRLDTPMQSDAETSGVSSGNEADSEMESESSRAVSPCFYTDTYVLRTIHISVVTRSTDNLFLAIVNSPANVRPPFYLYPAPPPLPQIPPPPETGSRTCSRPVSPSPSTSSNWDLADTEYSSFDELDMNNSSHDSDFDDLYAPPVPI